MELKQLVERAHQSMLFTAPVAGRDLRRFLSDQAPGILELAKRALAERVEHIYWAGSGNSWVNLYSGKCILDRFTTVPSDCLTSYGLVWRSPKRLDPRAWVFTASFSGATEDTVQALRYANNRGARTVAIVNQADSLMGQEADEVVSYDSTALYLLPLAAACLFSLEVARLQGFAGAREIIDGLYEIPDLLEKQYVQEQAPARALAQEYASESLFYVLGTGPLYGLAYKFGLTVFMENMRVNGSFIDASEFRHGPAEALDREKPAMVILLGTDASRPLVTRVQRLVEERGARVIVYDAADYPGVHPLLTPFALMIPLQWFAVYSAFLRGITDLDERVLMGHGKLSSGEGITWP